MKPPVIMFCVLLAMCAVVGAALLTEEVPHIDKTDDAGITKRIHLGHSVPHPSIPVLLNGGPGPDRHNSILWHGLALGLLQVIFFVLCLSLAMSKKGVIGPYKPVLIMGGIIYVCIFACLVFSYHTYMTEEVHGLILSQPKPTAWMVYALWGFPVFFILLYMFAFDRWYLTPADMDRFKALVAEKRAQNGENA